MSTFTDLQATQPYILGTIFLAPTDEGPIKAIAVPASTGKYLVSLYTALVSWALVLFWLFLRHLALLYSLYSIPHLGLTDTDTTGAGVALAGFVNAGTPFAGLVFGGEYLYALSRGGWRRKLAVVGVVILLLPVFIVVGGQAGVIILGGGLSVESVAPANPEAVFVPYVNRTKFEPDVADMLMQAVKAPAAMRAVGAVDDSMEGLEESVRVFVSDEGRGKRVKYEYHISGTDLGLGNLTELQYDVKGECVTEWGWLKKSSAGSDKEQYVLYESQNNVVTVEGRNESERPPRVEAYIHPVKNMYSGANVSFAIVLHATGRKSYSNSTDPWYHTEPNTDTEGTNENPPPFQVMHGRPPLSCWQEDTWSYKGFQFGRPGEMKANISMPNSWKWLLYNHFQFPKLFDLSNTLSNSILKSSAYFRGNTRLGLFDAQMSTLEADLRRMVAASYVSSRNAFQDATRTERLKGSDRLKNLAGEVGDAGFTIQSKDVMALKLSTLIAVPCVIVILGAIVCIMKGPMLWWPMGRTGQRYANRFEAIQPAYLFVRRPLSPAPDEERTWNEGEGWERHLKNHLRRACGRESGDWLLRSTKRTKSPSMTIATTPAPFTVPSPYSPEIYTPGSGYTSSGPYTPGMEGRDRRDGRDSSRGIYSP